MIVIHQNYATSTDYTHKNSSAPLSTLPQWLKQLDQDNVEIHYSEDSIKIINRSENPVIINDNIHISSLEIDSTAPIVFHGHLVTEHLSLRAPSVYLMGEVMSIGNPQTHIVAESLEINGTFKSNFVQLEVEYLKTRNESKVLLDHANLHADSLDITGEFSLTHSEVHCASICQYSGISHFSETTIQSKEEVVIQEEAECHMNRVQLTSENFSFDGNGSIDQSKISANHNIEMYGVEHLKITQTHLSAAHEFVSNRTVDLKETKISSSFVDLYGHPTLCHVLLDAKKVNFAPSEISTENVFVRSKFFMAENKNPERLIFNGIHVLTKNASFSGPIKLKNSLVVTSFVYEHFVLYDVLQDEQSLLHSIGFFTNLGSQELHQMTMQYIRAFPHDFDQWINSDITAREKYLDRMQNLNARGGQAEFIALSRALSRSILVLDLNGRVLLSNLVENASNPPLFLLQNKENLYNPLCIRDGETNADALYEKLIRLDDQSRPTGTVSIQGDFKVSLSSFVSDGQLYSSSGELTVSQSDIHVKTLHNQETGMTLKKKSVIHADVLHQVNRSLCMMSAMLDIQKRFFTEQSHVEVKQSLIQTEEAIVSGQIKVEGRSSLQVSKKMVVTSGTELTAETSPVKAENLTVLGTVRTDAFLQAKQADVYGELVATGKAPSPDANTPPNLKAVVRVEEQLSIKTEGKVTLKQTELSAKKASVEGEVKATETFFDLTDLTTTYGSRADIGTSCLSADRFQMNGRLVFTDANLQVHHFKTGLWSEMCGHSLCLDGDDWEHNGTLKLTGNLRATGKYVDNWGTIQSDGGLFLGYDHYVLNPGTIEGRNVQIHSNLLNVFGSIKAAESLDTAGFLNVNLGGVLRGTTIHQSALLSLNAGLIMPNLTWDALFNKENALQAGLILSSYVAPGFYRVATGGKALFGLFQIGKRLWENRSHMSFGELRKKRLYEIMPIVCSVKDTAQMAYANFKMAYGVGASFFDETNPQILGSVFSFKPQMPAWKDVGINMLSMFGSSYTDTSLLRVNAGALFSQRAFETSVCNVNLGLELCGNHTQSTYLFANLGAMDSVTSTFTFQKGFNEGFMQSVGSSCVFGGHLTQGKTGGLSLRNASIQLDEFDEGGHSVFLDSKTSIGKHYLRNGSQTDVIGGTYKASIIPESGAHFLARPSAHQPIVLDFQSSSIGGTFSIDQAQCTYQNLQIREGAKLEFNASHLDGDHIANQGQLFTWDTTLTAGQYEEQGQSIFVRGTTTLDDLQMRQKGAMTIVDGSMTTHLTSHEGSTFVATATDPNNRVVVNLKGPSHTTDSGVPEPQTTAIGGVVILDRSNVDFKAIRVQESGKLKASDSKLDGDRIENHGRNPDVGWLLTFLSPGEQRDETALPLAEGNIEIEESDGVTITGSVIKLKQYDEYGSSLIHQSTSTINDIHLRQDGSMVVLDGSIKGQFTPEIESKFIAIGTDPENLVQVDLTMTTLPGGIRLENANAQLHNVRVQEGGDLEGVHSQINCETVQNEGQVHIGGQSTFKFKTYEGAGVTTLSSSETTLGEYQLKTGGRLEINDGKFTAKLTAAAGSELIARTTLDPKKPVHLDLQQTSTLGGNVTLEGAKVDYQQLALTPDGRLDAEYSDVVGKKFVNNGEVTARSSGWVSDEYQAKPGSITNLLGGLFRTKFKSEKDSEFFAMENDSEKPFIEFEGKTLIDGRVDINDAYLKTGKIVKGKTGRFETLDCITDIEALENHGQVSLYNTTGHIGNMVDYGKTSFHDCHMTIQDYQAKAGALMSVFGGSFSTKARINSKATFFAMSTEGGAPVQLHFLENSSVDGTMHIWDAHVKSLGVFAVRPEGSFQMSQSTFTGDFFSNRGMADFSQVQMHMGDGFYNGGNVSTDQFDFQGPRLENQGFWEQRNRLSIDVDHIVQGERGMMVAEGPNAWVSIHAQRENIAGTMDLNALRFEVANFHDHEDFLGSTGRFRNIRTRALEYHTSDDIRIDRPILREGDLDLYTRSLRVESEGMECRGNLSVHTRGGNLTLNHGYLIGQNLSLDARGDIRSYDSLLCGRKRISAKSSGDMVYQGGAFVGGDFGTIHAKGKVIFSSLIEDNPDEEGGVEYHPVQLFVGEGKRNHGIGLQVDSKDAIVLDAPQITTKGVTEFHGENGEFVLKREQAPQRESEDPYALSFDVDGVRIGRKRRKGGRKQCYDLENGRYVNPKKVIIEHAKKGSRPHANAEAEGEIKIFELHGEARELWSASPLHLTETLAIHPCIVDDGGKMYASAKFDPHKLHLCIEAGADRSVRFNLIEDQIHLPVLGDIHYEVNAAELALAANATLSTERGFDMHADAKAVLMGPSLSATTQEHEFCAFGLKLGLQGEGLVGLGLGAEAGAGVTVMKTKPEVAFYARAGARAFFGASAKAKATIGIDTEIVDRFVHEMEKTLKDPNIHEMHKSLARDKAELMQRKPESLGGKLKQIFELGCLGQVEGEFNESIGTNAAINAMFSHSIR